MMKFGKIEKPVYIRDDDRGQFIELINFGDWQSIITGNMKKDAEMGHHYHEYTILYYYLITGNVEIRTHNLKTDEKKTEYLLCGEAYIFKPEEVRVIKYIEDSSFIMMKSHRFDSKKPDIIDYKMKL